MFWRAEDLGLRRFFAGGPRLERAELEAVARVVAERQAVGIGALAEATGLKPGRATSAVGWLAREGAVAVGPGGEPVVTVDGADPSRAAAAAAAAAKARRRLDRSRVEMMRSYAETRDCRRQLLLGYFGEPADRPCGNCDNCDAGGAGGRPVNAPGKGRFLAGGRVRHRTLGDGTVMRTDGDTLVVLFDEHGYTTLSIPLVDEGNLLRSVTVGRR